MINTYNAQHFLDESGDTWLTAQFYHIYVSFLTETKNMMIKLTVHVYILNIHTSQ